MKKLASIILLSSATTATMASDYNIEADVSFTTKNYYNEDINSTLLDVTYYLNDIDDTKGPLAESAFLNQSSELSVKYGLASQTYLDNYTTWGLAGKYISDSGLIIGAGYTSKGITNVTGEESIIDSGYLELGGYFTDVSALIFNYSSNQNENFVDNASDQIIRSNTSSLAYNHLFLMENNKSIKLNAKYAYTNYSKAKYSDDDFGTFDLSGDYYFNRQLSTGLEFTRFNTVEDETVTRYGLRSTYFFNDTISVYGSVRIADVEYSSDDINTFKIGFQTRF